MKPIEDLLAWLCAVLAALAGCDAKTIEVPMVSMTSNALIAIGWQQLPGSAIDIAVGANGAAWVITPTQSIMRWTGSTWQQYPGAAVRIAVGPDGGPWVVNAQGLIFRWIGTTWQQMPSVAQDIGTGADGSIWITAPSGGIYKWDGSTWRQFPGAAVRIAVGPAGDPWVVNAQGLIFHWMGASWQQLPGTAQDIGVGADRSAFIIGTTPIATPTERPIYKWTGADWAQTVGTAVQVSVGPSGDGWVVNSSNLIFASGSMSVLPTPRPAPVTSLTPANGTVFSANTTSVTFAWAPVTGMNRYLVRCVDNTTAQTVAYDDAATAAPAHVPVIPGHTYTFWVHAATADYPSGAPASYGDAAATNISISTSLAVSSEQSSLVLGIEGNHFTVNGTAKFLVFASYFDALDVSDADIEADLTYLQQHGIDGIRILPDWRTQNCRDPNDKQCVPNDHCAGDTVMDPGGDLREGPFNNMIYVLNKAKEHGMIVDISLSSELVSSIPSCPSTLTLLELKAGVTRLTDRLKGPGYRHVMFDLQNEVDDGDIRIATSDQSPGGYAITMENIATLIDSKVHAIDPDRIVFASLTRATGNASKVDDPLGNDANAIKKAVTDQHGMVIAYHDPRVNKGADHDDWFNETTTVVRNLSDGRPVYLQEPARVEEVATWKGLIAVQNAKLAGAAAWTFHTSAGYFMNDHGIAWHLREDTTYRAYPAESDFLNHLANTLANTSWGVTAEDQPVSLDPPLTKPGYPSLTDFTGDHRADLGEWHRPSGQFWVRANTVNATQPIGQWWSHSSTVTPTPGWEVLVADFNGDGYADYMDRHLASGKVWIHLGTGAGGFSPNVWVTGQTRAGVDIEVFPGDVNGDHRADLIEHSRATGDLHVRINTGIADPVQNADIINPNNFLLSRDPAAFHTAIGSDWRTVVGDFTGDGYVDIVDYHVPSSHFWVHANIGANQWNGNSLYDYVAFSYPGFTTIFGDFTGDGWADYADVNTVSGEMWVHENLHNGTFSGTNWLYTLISHSSGFCVMGLPVCW